VKTRSARSRSWSANDEFLSFTASVDFDRRLWKYDIAGSIAHAHTLAHAGVITQMELKRMTSGLKAIARDVSNGNARLDPHLEDVHMNIESMVTKRIGNTGEKLHTGRSRNDQVALDLRLAAREMLVRTTLEVLGIQDALLRMANDNSNTVMPGYTHLQHAQPVLLSHHLLAHFWRLDRDMQRILQCYSRTNISPLGSGALAGTGFGLDRTICAKMLMMKQVTENSLDAVSDRDFVAEAAFALSLLMIHLSSLCEELVLWSSHEFGFVRLPKKLSSGSSMMPQKRNPDIPELVRGKSGRVVGDLVAILTVLKSLPLAYNRDLQEDKENLFDVFDTVGASLHALTTFLTELEFDAVRMGKSAEAGLMTATDLADFLASQGVPFRTAHGIIRDIAEESGGDQAKFNEIAADAITKIVPNVNRSRLSQFTVEKSVSRRDSDGGTALPAVAKQTKKANAAMARNRRALEELTAHVAAVDKLLGL